VAFIAKLEQRSSYQPRLDRVLVGIEWSLGQDPYLNARKAGERTWVIETPRDLEAPTLWVYYTIRDRVVTLHDYVIVATWTP